MKTKISFKTILDAKEYLKLNVNSGVACPCCDQFVKLYNRKVGSVMARMLIRLYKMSAEWNHVKDIAHTVSYTGSADFAKLSYWKLIEEMPNDDQKKKEHLVIGE